eukprot:6801472-Pyramimonas_sp.AAC.1
MQGALNSNGGFFKYSRKDQMRYLTAGTQNERLVLFRADWLKKAWHKQDFAEFEDALLVKAEDPRNISGIKALVNRRRKDPYWTYEYNASAFNNPNDAYWGLYEMYGE